MLSHNSISDIRKFVLEWNIKFPIDRWWREKYKQSFNSPIHRECSFIDMAIEFQDDVMFDELRQGYEQQNEKNEEGEFVNKYNKGTGNFQGLLQISKKQIDEQFDKIDLNSIEL